MSPPMEPCGISGCQTLHLRGFVVELDDERKSHVGKDCGRTLFGASWGQQLARLRQEKDAVAAQEALKEARRSAVDEAEDLSALSSEEVIWAITMLRQFESWPRKLVDELSRMAMAARADGSIFRKRKATSLEQQTARFHGEAVPVEINDLVGRLDGIKAIAPNTRADIVAGRMRAKAQVLKTMADDPASSAADLEHEIRSMRNMKQTLARSRHYARLFFRRENMHLFRVLDPTFDGRGLK